MKVRRTLHRLGWSRKRMRIANQHNAFLQESWFAAPTDWRPDQLVFLEGSAASERTGKYLVVFSNHALTSAGNRKWMGATKYKAVGQRRIQAVKEINSATCIYYIILTVLDHPPGFGYSKNCYRRRMRSRPHLLR